MAWRLSDLDSNEVIILTHGDILGRSEGHHTFPTCDKMSRSHCQFLIESNHAYLMDLGSRNGTFINSERCEANVKVRLVDGQIIMFGNKTFMLKNKDDNTNTMKLSSAPSNSKKRR